MGGTCPSESIALARLAPIVGTLSTGQVGPQHTETGDCQTCEHDLGVSHLACCFPLSGSSYRPVFRPGFSLGRATMRP